MICWPYLFACDLNGLAARAIPLCLGHQSSDVKCGASFPVLHRGQSDNALEESSEIRL